MAARLKAYHQEHVRQLIQVNRLVARLQQFALGRKFNGYEVKMTSEQVRAALGLLNKRLPDLQAVQLSSDPDNPFKVEHELGGRASSLLAKVKGQGAAGGPRG